MNEVIILCLWINNRIFAAIFLNDILMNYGYVKVAAAVPRVKVADCKFNAREIEKEIIIAEGKGVQIIAFPELCVTGYTCGDLFAQQLLLEEAEMGLIQIVSNTRQLDIIAILGMPIAMNGVLLNAAVVIQKGKVLGVVPKTYLPNYKEFYEKRWFTSAVDVSEGACAFVGRWFQWELTYCSKLRIRRSALKFVRIYGHLFRPVLHWHCKVRKFCLICRRIMKGLVSTTICVL